MRRSSVINIIENLLTEQRKDLDNGSDYQDADQILSKLEQLGMLPPSYTFWNSPNSKDVNEKGIPKILNVSLFNGDNINEWEPEDVS